MAFACPRKVSSSKSVSRKSSKLSCRRPATCCPSVCSPNYQEKPASNSPSSQCIAGAIYCPNHPRPDCCLVPPPGPCLPRCPLGIPVKRTEPCLPDTRYRPPTVAIDGLTTYRDHYFNRCGGPSKSCRPLCTFVPSEVPLEGVSTYKDHYYCKPVTPKQIPPWAIKKYIPSCAPMDGITQYKNDYPGCQVPPAPSAKPTCTFVPSDQKIEGLTTYRLKYIPYCPREYDYARQGPIYPLPEKPHCAPMEKVTTYRCDYFPKCLVRTNPIKPSRPRFSCAAICDLTTYKTAYTPFHFEKCCPCPCIPALIYDGLPKPCMFACEGDKKEVCEDDCNDPCPPKPGCCEQLQCGLPKGADFPCDVGTAGRMIQPCCDCLNDPPLPDEGECPDPEC